MSTQRDALIAAIREAPDDDDLRRVCADWFEDQGDAASVARAEFIRIQLRRDSLPPADPEHSALQARELRLAKQWARVWCPQHYARKVTFRRGFVERVHIHLKHWLHHRREMLTLEPVRDICLTGFRGGRGDLPDLVRRVAACEEWQWIEALQIHHQGPHKEPPAEVLTLLESPHLARLKTLHIPALAVDAEGRRRFERLSLLEQIEDLWLPHLDEWLIQGGSWFAEGAPPAWRNVRKLYLTGSSAETVRRLVAMPFWPRLTALSGAFRHGRGADIVDLTAHLPPGLLALTLWGGAMGSAEPAFVERLRALPLRSLSLNGQTLSAPALGRLLDGTGRLDLEELTLENMVLREAHLAALAQAPAVARLHALNCPPDPENRLFGLANLAGLTELSLTVESEPEHAQFAALAAARHWEHLRRLTLGLYKVPTEAIIDLLAAPHLRSLVVLDIKAQSGREGPGVDLTLPLAQALLRLPHLAVVDLEVRARDAQAHRMLVEGVPWVRVQCHDDDIAAYRANRAPELLPPVEV